jgi:hypothetical protein
VPTSAATYVGDGVGAPLPVDVAIAAPTLEPIVFATIPGGSVSVSENGISALDNGVVHVYDLTGVEVGSVVLQDTFVSFASLYAGPDRCFYVDHYLPPNDGTAVPRRVVTVFDATGAKVDEGPIASDLGGEQEPFLAFGVGGLVDRIAGTTVVPYCDGIVRGPEPSEQYPDDLPGATADTFILGDERWVVPINRDPNAAVLYSGEPWPELGPHGGLVATRWIGPSLTGPPTDYGTPSGLVLIRMREGGAVDWFHIADDWRLVGSTANATLLLRGNAAGGTDLAWVFGSSG